MGERPRRAPEGRRLGKACPASDLPAWHCLGQRDRTMDASWPTEKIERRPAGKEELAIVANDDTATRAERGQSKIENGSGQGRERGCQDVKIQVGDVSSKKKKNQ